MLLLTFLVGENLYAVEAGPIMEVVPAVALRSVPRAPAPLAGLLSYRGEVVPAVDLGLVMGVGACRPRLSTRIMVVRYPLPGREPARLGLIAERVSDVRRVIKPVEVFPAMPMPEAPYFGPILQIDAGLVQLIIIEHLLTDDLRGALFGDPTPIPHPSSHDLATEH
jgi:chemotaxis-related protein WspB